MTYHDDPVFVKDGVVNYCVGNMPGAVSCTSTNALTNATLQYGLSIAKHGPQAALQKNPFLLEGLNVYRGKITYKNVAEAHNIDYVPAIEAI